MRLKIILIAAILSNPLIGQCQVIQFEDTLIYFNQLYSSKPLYNEMGIATLTEVKQRQVFKITVLDNCLNSVWSKTIRYKTVYFSWPEIFVDSNNNVYALLFLKDAISNDDSSYFNLIKFYANGKQCYSKRIRAPNGLFMRSTTTNLTVNTVNGDLYFASELSYGNQERGLFLLKLDSLGKELKQVLYKTQGESLDIKNIDVDALGLITIQALSNTAIYKKQIKLLYFNSSLNLVQKDEMGFADLSLIEIYTPRIYKDRDHQLLIFSNGKDDGDKGALENLVLIGSDLKQKWNLQLLDSSVRNTRMHMAFKQDSLFYVHVICINKAFDTAFLKIAVISETGRLVNYFKVSSKAPSYKWLHQINNFCLSAKGQMLITWFNGVNYGVSRFDTSSLDCINIKQENTAWLKKITDKKLNLEFNTNKYLIDLDNKFDVTSQKIVITDEPRVISKLCGFNQSSTKSVIGDTFICEKSYTILSAKSKLNYTYKWFNGFEVDSVRIDSSGNYWVDKEYKGCRSRDRATVIFSKNIIDSIKSVYTFCQGEILKVKLPKIKDLIFSVDSNQTSNKINGNLLQIQDSSVFELGYNYYNKCFGEIKVKGDYYKNPIASVKMPDVICPKSDVTIVGLANEEVIWVWGSDSTAQSINSNYTLKVENDTSFVLTTTNMSGCYFYDSIRLSLLDSIKPEIVGSASLCIGSKAFYWPSIERDTSLYDFLWDNKFKTTSYGLNINEDRVIRLSVIDKCKRVYFDSLYVKTLPKPVYDFKIVGESFKTDTIYAYQLIFNDSDKYYWIFDTTDVLIDTELRNIEFKDFGKKRLKIKMLTNNGCSDSTVYNFDVTLNHLIFIPNAFSPNGDLKNDSWVVKGNFNSIEMSIFSRTGQRLINTTELVWDGTFGNGNSVGIGSFFYIIDCKFADGLHLTKFGVLHVLK